MPIGGRGTGSILKNDPVLKPRGILENRGDNLVQPLWNFNYSQIRRDFDILSSLIKQ